MTDYYVYMMVLELVAIAHAVLTGPQHGRRLCKPGGVNLCGDRYQFRLERDDVQWPRPRLAACTMRTTYVALAPALGRQPIPKLFRWLPLAWTVFYCLIRCFRRLPGGFDWGPCCAFSHVAPAKKIDLRITSIFSGT